MSKLQRITRNCCDAVIAIAACVLALTLPRWLKLQRQGFYCSDESLLYPFRENTVDVVMLFVGVVCLPLVMIVTLELLRTTTPPPATATGQRAASQRDVSGAPGGGYQLGRRLLRSLAQIGYFLYGLALVLLASLVTKFTVGRLRPHFWAVCQPRMPDGSTCADPQNHARYIEDYTCSATNMSPTIVDQVSQSFPSAHASLFCYAMLYVALYVQHILRTHYSRLFKHLLQFVFAMIALYVSLTRVADFWHHWSDVLAGAALGIAIGIFVTVQVARVCGDAARGRAGTTTMTMSSVAVKPTVKASSTTAAAAAATPVLPAYTFGTMPYLQHAQSQYAQPYHNYGYVS